MTNTECLNVLRAMAIGYSVTEKEAIDHVEKLIKKAKKAKRWKRKYIELLNDKFQKQESKRGHWIDFKYPLFICSECKAVRENESFLENYCPNCGCRMVEPQESEEV